MRRFLLVACTLCSSGVLSAQAQQPQPQQARPQDDLECRRAMIRADVNDDERINKAEFINLLKDLSPYVDCPDVGNVQDFLGTAPFAQTFEEHACLCQDYIKDEAEAAQCCDKGNQSLAVPDSGNFPANYTDTVCTAIRNVLDSECQGASLKPTPSPATAFPSSIPSMRPSNRPSLRPASNVPTLAGSLDPTTNLLPTSLIVEDPKTTSRPQPPTSSSPSLTETPTISPNLQRIVDRGGGDGEQEEAAAAQEQVGGSSKGTSASRAAKIAIPVVLLSAALLAMVLVTRIVRRRRRSSILDGQQQQQQQRQKPSSSQSSFFKGGYYDDQKVFHQKPGHKEDPTELTTAQDFENQQQQQQQQQQHSPDRMSALINSLSLEENDVVERSKSPFAPSNVSSLDIYDDLPSDASAGEPPQPKRGRSAMELLVGQQADITATTSPNDDNVNQSLEDHYNTSTDTDDLSGVGFRSFDSEESSPKGISGWTMTTTSLGSNNNNYFDIPNNNRHDPTTSSGLPMITAVLQPTDALQQQSHDDEVDEEGAFGVVKGLGGTFVSKNTIT